MIELATTLWHASEVLMGIAALLCLVRAVRGPSVFDRALAIDALALAVVGHLMLRSLTEGQRVYTDAALGLALFAFVGTVLMAHFLAEGEFPAGSPSRRSGGPGDGQPKTRTGPSPDAGETK